MISLFRLIVVTIFSTAFVFFGGLAHAQAFPDVIAGKVINNSFMGSSVEGSKVSLYGKDLNKEFLIQEQLLGEDGFFEFNDLQISPVARYFVSVEFLGVFYVEEVVNDDGSWPEEILINVYETTSNEDVIEALSASILFSGVNKDLNRISVMEIVRLSNSSQLTYIPGDGPMDLIRFGLPEGANSLNVDSGIVGADFIQVDKGFALVAKIPPGEHEIAYTYFLNYQDARLDFTHSLRYGAGILRILIHEDDGNIDSREFDSPQLTDIGGQNYFVVESKEIPKGQNISVNIFNLPENSYLQKSFTQFKSIRYEFFPVSILLLLLAGFLVFGYFKSDSQ